MGLIKKLVGRVRSAASGLEWQDYAAAIMPTAYLANVTPARAVNTRAQGGSLTEGAMDSLSPVYKALGNTAQPTPGAIPAAPAMAQVDAAAMAQRRRQRLAGALGRQSTILTGPNGVTTIGGGTGRTLLGM